MHRFAAGDRQVTGLFSLIALEQAQKKIQLRRDWLSAEESGLEFPVTYFPQVARLRLRSIRRKTCRLQHTARVVQIQHQEKTVDIVLDEASWQLRQRYLARFGINARIRRRPIDRGAVEKPEQRRGQLCAHRAGCCREQAAAVD